MDLLKNKVALITGGSSGIGLDGAKAMISEGAFVYITGRNEKRLQEAFKDLKENVSYIVADSAVKKDMLKVYETIKADNRTVDVVFANAGVGKYIAFEQITEEDIDWTFDINVKGTIFTIQSVFPLLNDGASIILNTSVTSDIGLPDFSLYAASKAAVKSFIYSWTKDFENKKIRVNAISPGIIPTAAAMGELGRDSDEELERQAYRAALTPLARVGHVQDVSNALLFLASDQSSFITGTEIKVDGGLTAVYATKL
jgi:NAD(P)-dependent dehydrogenase (short-subunit alcohol dehydrogenase family)